MSAKPKKRQKQKAVDTDLVRSDAPEYASELRLGVSLGRFVPARTGERFWGAAVHGFDHHGFGIGVSYAAVPLQATISATGSNSLCHAATSKILWPDG
jgi:hypothetical protein